MPGQIAERLSDGLITIPRRVLVDERSSGTGVSKSGHQLFETRASGSGKGSARMPEIVKMEVRLTSVLARLDPYAVEVGSPEPCPLRADEDKTTLPRLSEQLQMPPNLGHEVGVKSDAPTTRLRLWRLRSQHTRVELGGRLHNPNLARRQVDVVAPQSYEFTPAKTSEGSEQGGAFGADGPASAPGSAFPEARPAQAGPQSRGAHRSRRRARRAARSCTGHLPRHTIVQLAAAASRALPTVTSHAIGFADPRPKFPPGLVGRHV